MSVPEPVLSAAADLIGDRRRPVRALFAGIAVCLLLLAVGYLTLVSTASGHQLDNDAYFGREVLARSVVGFDKTLLDVFTPVSLALILLALLAVAATRRITIVGGIAVAGVVVAVVGAEVFKHVLPWHELVASDAALQPSLRAETYPSGHSTIATSLMLAVIIISPRRWRAWLAVAGGAVSASFTTGVLFAGWHRPSDAIGGICWSGAVLGAAALIAVLARGGRFGQACARPVSHVAVIAPLVASAAVALLVYIGFWAVAESGRPDYPDADEPFLFLTGAIIVGSFAVTAWLGHVLSAVQWRSEPDHGRRWNGQDQRPGRSAAGSSASTASNPR